jgi:hypothetical protein
MFQQFHKDKKTNNSLQKLQKMPLQIENGIERGHYSKEWL